MLVSKCRPYLASSTLPRHQDVEKNLPAPLRNKGRCDGSAYKQMNKMVAHISYACAQEMCTVAHISYACAHDYCATVIAEMERASAS